MSIYNRGTKGIWFERWGLVAILLLILSTFTVSSQDDRRNRRIRRETDGKELAADSSVSVLTDSMAAIKDSISRADSIRKQDSLSLLQMRSLDAPAFTAAKDSIVEDFSDGKQIIYYYGDVSVKYGNMKLTADYMEYDLKTSTLYARGTTDTAGGVKGRPVMEQGGQSHPNRTAYFTERTSR